MIIHRILVPCRLERHGTREERFVTGCGDENLAITPSIKYPELFTVTHVATGLAIVQGISFQEALEAYQKIHQYPWQDVTLEKWEDDMIPWKAAVRILLRGSE